jgi:hypothetical protein
VALVAIASVARLRKLAAQLGGCNEALKGRTAHGFGDSKVKVRGPEKGCITENFAIRHHIALSGIILGHFSAKDQCPNGGSLSEGE